VDASTSWSNYFRESSRPLSSLLFVAPLLLAYEGGVMVLGRSAVRNGADVWLRDSLDRIGFGHYFLLPILTCGLLLAWHHMRREAWQVNWSVCYGMMVESVLFGWILLLLAQLQGSFFEAQIKVDDYANIRSTARLIGYIGAGVYEELLFRLMLLPAVIVSLKAFGVPLKWSAGIAVVATSLVFAGAHYQVDIDFAGFQFASTHGESFEWFSFSFRALAGVFFSILFVVRGFGIAVGAHALYDVLVLVT
jgi:hypothetical protein